MDNGPIAFSNQLNNIPPEMRARRQWCYSTLALKPDGKPDKAPMDPKAWNGQPVNASVTDPSTWGTFEDACRAAAHVGGRIGFVLTADDPFVVIDLDDKGDLTPEQATRLAKISEYFAGTYQEVSQSGQGVHIVLRDERPLPWTGVRRDSVEVYRTERYIIMTGNAETPVPPAHMAEELDLLVEEINRGRVAAAELPPAQDQRFRDDEVLDRMFSRSQRWGNTTETSGERIRRWHKQGTLDGEDWSACDFNYLVAAIFASKGNWEQALRLFETSALWRGEGAPVQKYRNPITYVDGYLMRHTLPKAWGKYAAWAAKTDQTVEIAVSRMQLGEVDASREIDAPSAAIDDNAASWASPLDPRTAPGLIGFATCEHAWYRAKRQTPIPGFLAHLLATSTIMGLGFRSTFKDSPDYANLQILGLLPSLFGKEDIVSEVNWALDLARSLRMRLNFSMGYASSQAVHTAFHNDPYQCSLEDEAGRKAQQQRQGGGDLHQSGVVTFFMEMFARYFVPSRPYSNSENRKPKVPYAYATLLRLSQPETLAPTLEKANVTDGQLNRPYFVYEPKVPPKHPYGERTYRAQSDTLTRAYKILAHWSLPANETAVAHADNELKAARDEKYVWLVLPAPLAIPVAPTPEAETVYKHFDDWCERQVQAGYPIWGRAGQNAKRFAMVLAVGEVALQAVAHTAELPPAPDAISISAETMKWACAEVAGRLRSLGLFAKEEIHGADLDGLIAARVIKYLNDHGKTMRASRVVNAIQKNTGYTYSRIREVTRAMIETEQLSANGSWTGGNIPGGLVISLYQA